MSLKRILIAALSLMLLLTAAAQADGLQKIWMEYEDYSGNRAEQAVEDPAVIQELEQMLLRARNNPAQLDGCTLNATLFCMTGDGKIYDFACATDGCPFIQSRTNEGVYNLGVDFQRFWEIFADVRTGMGYDATSVFDLPEDED